MIVTERHHIQSTQEIIRLCTHSKELYNKCNYLLRKTWFAHTTQPNFTQLVHQVQTYECYQDLHNTKTAKQTIRKCLSDWSNFFSSLKAWNKDPTKFENKPRPPYYKDKLAQVIFFDETIRKKPTRQGYIVPTNDLFKIKSNKKFRQVIVQPKTFGFIIDVQYDKEPKDHETDPNKICCIDVGVNNLATITSDQLFPILVNGRIVKSFNQYYNKHKTKQNSQKRYFRLENYFHHVSKFIVKYCLDNSLGHIIIGKNDGWKKDVKMRKKDKQNFQYIPYIRLFKKIEYKAALVGINVSFTEEAYTSKASFFDKDPIPPYQEDVAPPMFSGKRKHRGLYVTKDEFALNSDVNGSYNIGRKVIPEFSVIGDRSIAAMPVRINPLKAFLSSK